MTFVTITSFKLVFLTPALAQNGESAKCPGFDRVVKNFNYIHRCRDRKYEIATTRGLTCTFDDCREVCNKLMQSASDGVGSGDIVYKSLKESSTQAYVEKILEVSRGRAAWIGGKESESRYELVDGTNWLPEEHFARLRLGTGLEEGCVMVEADGAIGIAECSRELEAICERKIPRDETCP